MGGQPYILPRALSAYKPTGREAAGNPSGSQAVAGTTPRLTALGFPSVVDASGDVAASRERETQAEALGFPRAGDASGGVARGRRPRRHCGRGAYPETVSSQSANFGYVRSRSNSAAARRRAPWRQAVSRLRSAANPPIARASDEASPAV